MIKSGFKNIIIRGILKVLPLNCKSSVIFSSSRGSDEYRQRTCIIIWIYNYYYANSCAVDIIHPWHLGITTKGNTEDA